MIQKNTLIISLLLFIFQFAFCQSPILVEDYIFGTQGSADGRIYNFDGILTYEGTSQFGEQAILQYDKHTDDITVLATNEDFDGAIIRISSNTEEMAILTGDIPAIRNFYRSYENDFSDLELIYNSGDAELIRFRFYEGYYLLIEENTDGIDYTTNFKLYDLDGEISDLFIGLPGRSNDYLILAAQGHFLIAPRVELINDKTLLAYNLESKSFVPITNIIPDFEDCGLISSLGGPPESIIYYNCETKHYFDLNTNQYLSPFLTDYLNINEGSLIYDNEDYIYFRGISKLLKINKTTGQEELILDEIFSSRFTFSHLVNLSNNNDQISISIYDFEEEKLYTYPTNFAPGIIYRISGFGIVESGIHMIIYEIESDNGVLININSDSFTVIDSVFNVNFLNRPVAYDEDIYFTHQDPEVGNELFFIDYDVTSTKEIAIPSKINIYPNPVQNSIKITHQEDSALESISIIDINGKIIKDQILTDDIDVSDLIAGMYIIQTTYQNGKVSTGRFIVN